MDIRILFKRLLVAGASSFIIVHNHPSGNRKPSPNDVKTTKKIKECSELLDLKLLDHIIITGDDWYSSFGKEGLL